MNDFQRFRDLSELKEYVNNIPDTSDFISASMERYYDGYWHLNLCFIDDKQLGPIYHEKAKGHERVNDGVIAILFALLSGILWLTVMSMPANQSDQMYVTFFPVFMSIMLTTGIMLIVIGARRIRKFRTLLKEYEQSKI